MSQSRLVYSTEGSNNCLRCGKPLRKCSCPKEQVLPTNPDEVIRIARETKGRKGAGVTLITGLQLQADELKALAKQLKAHCGSGGTTRPGVIEIQGDKRQQIESFFEKRGARVKISGG
ncbi:MAG TPA: stress response translation initiation inhibitor YciH [Gammaproteobacteria bacterium]|nr:stress response translation initiation inhibitor YciH [Gammaproteobacteria bacterium]